MQKQQAKPNFKITIPRYSDKYKDVMRREEQKTPPSPPLHSQTPPANPFFFYKVKTIGVGAHSFVSLVQEQSTKLLIAEKAITRDHAYKYIEQITREIKILSLCDHQNIIKLYHIATTQTHLSLYMEFAEDSLFALKQKFGLFKEKQVVQIIRQLLNGLHYLHERGIVHADIKLENIMIANGTIKLCDFGYAHLHQAATLESKKEIVGTMEYLPPEYAQGYDSGAKRDIWAIGILIFEMLVGHNPFESLRQNQKWSKLIKNKPQAYLQELQMLQKQSKGNSDRIIQVLQHIFCSSESRWSAEQLLQLPVFTPVVK